MFTVIPSIDIYNGKPVQLKNGKTLEITSDENPVELVKRFGVACPVAIVDINAALGKGNNTALIKELCKHAEVRVGGGIRSIDVAKELLRAGASKLVIGTFATEEFCCRLPRDTVVVALDHTGGKISTEGWTKVEKEDFLARGKKLSKYCSEFLCTHIDTEGCMTGLTPHEDVYKLQQLGNTVTLAGGIRSQEEILSIIGKGFNAQIGMCLYTGEVDINSVVSSCIGEELIPTIIQEESGAVLGLAYSTKQSLYEALRKRQGVYFSRSRNTLWVKGETSGNTQELVKCRFDCDKDALLFTVKQKGNHCHTGTYGCFGNSEFTLSSLYNTISESSSLPEDKSYTSFLLSHPETIAGKCREEIYELVEEGSDTVWEASDIFYHILVFLYHRGCGLRDVMRELDYRNIKRKIR